MTCNFFIDFSKKETVMKSKLFIIMIILISITANAQDYDEPYRGPAIEESVPMEEMSDLSEELEQLEEDVLHPVGEVNDWSLGGEDLPAEDYE
jgi:hypothetical protein